MMVKLPFHLRYTLSRGQRLGPLVRSEGVWAAGLAVGMVGFFCFAAVMNAAAGEVKGGLFFVAMAGGVVVLYRRLFAGLVDVVMVGAKRMDVIVEESAVGMMIGGERWYFFLEGIREIRQWRRDLWTLRHGHGWMLHIPVALMSEEQIGHLRAGMERGRTAEGVRLMVERGRRIGEIEKRG